MESQPHPNRYGRELELELIRVRAEATAARLEARAAELELMLLGRSPQPQYEPSPLALQSGAGTSAQGMPGLPSLDRQQTDRPRPLQGQGTFASGHEDVAQALIQAIRRLAESSSGGAATAAGFGSTEPFAAAVQQTNGWDWRLQGMRSRVSEPFHSEAIGQSGSIAEATSDSASDIEQFASRIAMASQTSLETPPADKAAAAMPLPLAGDAISSAQEKSIRIDPANDAVNRPGMLDHPASEPSTDRQTPIGSSPSKGVVKRGSTAGRDDKQPGTVTETLPLSGGRQPTAPLKPKPMPIPVSISEAVAGEEKPKRWRPAGWLISTTAHVAGLLALGLLTLASPKPKDQLAFTASVSEASETAVESFTIESAEEMPDVTEPTMAETAAEISPLGTLQMADVSLDLPTAVAAPMTAMSGEASSQSMKLAQAAFKGDTLSKVQFAGLDGGGNHFVYLVDSSNSMKKFNDARTELLRSIDSLKPEQRFYVVFYDESPKYMRIANPSQDEPASVYATPENKQRFRRWAMAVQQARGQSPPEVLKFAFKLRPDVIFLLSDGEFTAQTETVIRENNFQENLFGESGPISIIHTIRYPGVSSTEGRQAETQMQRIAAENGGQYRNVEIP